jgi:hypothetical protein
VYYWLFLAVLGITTTGIKILKTKSNWYLFKSNSLLYFFIFIMSGAVDWDKYITDYNLKHAGSIASLDKRYLVSLSETNLKQLYDIKDHRDFNTDSIYHYGYYSRAQSNTAGLGNKLYSFLADTNNCWQSFNFRKARVAREIHDLQAAGKITSLDLSGNYITTLRPVYRLRELKELKLGAFDSDAFGGIVNFPKLEKLSVVDIDDKNFKYLEKLAHLETIVIYYYYSAVDANELTAKLTTTYPRLKVEQVKIE